MRILTWLFGEDKQKNRSANKSSQDIVADYGAVLENNAPPPVGVVADIKELPHSKYEIKKAIISLLVSVDDQNLKKHLCEAYHSLASWQPGVGQERKGVDLSAINLDSTEEESLNAVGSFVKSYEEWQRWEKIVNEEQEELLRDLVNLGF